MARRGDKRRTYLVRRSLLGFWKKIEISPSASPLLCSLVFSSSASLFFVFGFSCLSLFVFLVLLCPAPLFSFFVCVFSAESVIWGAKRNSLAKSLSGFLCFLPLSCLTLSSSLSILSHASFVFCFSSCPLGSGPCLCFYMVIFLVAHQ